MNRTTGIWAAAVLAATFAGCAAAPRLSSAPALSKAKGTVDFEPSLYKGTKIYVRIENLKDPEKLDPPGYSYVAWVQNERESPPQNVGALALDGDLNGVLKTTTPLHEFEFFVTVETSSDASQPSGPPLFWAHKDRELTADNGKPAAALGAE
jgi:hypothetical protein